MAKRNKMSRKFPPAPRKPGQRSASPTLSVTLIFNKYSRTKLQTFHLPCTRAELAYKLAETSFSMIEELAFHCNIKFLPEKEIEIENNC